MHDTRTLIVQLRLHGIICYSKNRLKLLHNQSLLEAERSAVWSYIVRTHILLQQTVLPYPSLICIRLFDYYNMYCA